MDKAETVIGRIYMHPKGFGFVQALDKNLEIFVPKRFIKDSVDGDIVKVEYFPEKETSKGFDGKVIEIIERKRKLLYALIVDRKGSRGYYAYSPIIGPSREIILKNASEKLKIGDRVVLLVKNWGGNKHPIKAAFHKKLGSIENPRLDIQATALEYYLDESFPIQCVEQAQSFGKSVTQQDYEGREDLTSLETFTIDPDTAKDFDDALSIQKTKKGYRLYVHIADVSYYVRPHSPIDIEAKQRANSTYLPGTCLPMLPEELSNHLCSLKERVKRLAVTTEMEFTKDGALLSYKIYRSVIKSQKRFTYRQAKELLDEKRKSKHLPSLEMMVELCLLLKAKRKERGSIDFALDEMKIQIDDKGVPTGFEKVEYDITHQLVEEFMLKNNEIIAQHCMENELPSIFRVHDYPDEEKLRNFYNYIKRLGYRLSDEPSAEEIQAIFEHAKDSPYAHHLSVHFIRSMRLAYYSEDNVGHYGLSLNNYLHFTSPIRRYTDLVVHRILFGEEIDNLPSIAKHCSAQERNSFKAESSMLAIKKLRFLDKMFDKDPYAKYEACITKCQPHGIFFEVLPFCIEGFLHISKLGKDYYIFNPQTEVIEGERTKMRFEVGKKICVEVLSIDLVYREVEWALINNR